MLALALFLLATPAHAGFLRWSRSDKVADRSVEPVRTEIAPALSEPMPFPDLAGMIGQRYGAKRPERAPLAPLPVLPDADTLPRRALGMIVERMGNYSNWMTVSRGASGHRDPMDSVRAEWMRQDSLRDVNDYLERLTPRQRRIADAAFKGGLAEIPDFDGRLPEHVSLDWILEHYPARGR